MPALARAVRQALAGLRQAGGAAHKRLPALAVRLRAVPVVGPVLGACGSWLGGAAAMVTTLGRVCLLVLVVSWYLAAGRHWLEAWFIALALATLMVLAALQTLGRATYRVRLSLVSTRVVVGDPALGSLYLSPPSQRATRPATVEMPVGQGMAVFDIPRLSPGAEHQEVFTVPTRHRGVITVGPVRSIRGDALGLVRRSQNWTEPVDLFIHPRTVNLDSTAIGFIRDIEGAVTQDLSSSDVAFHALREYTPGDDRRNVHWKTTARTGRLMVRQFEETRRAHLLVIHDLDPQAWDEEEDFETSVSASASLLLAAVRDSREISLVTQAGRPYLPTGARVLDTFTTLNPVEGTGDLVDLTRQAVSTVPQASVTVLVTGARTSASALHRAHAELPASTRCLALRINAREHLASQRVAGLPVVTLPDLEHLAPAMRKARS
ncbi:DUF58 domain-containing protein [Actinomyces oris]|uniref:DUF58 domain-containing protein n=1 Tax=Actinomyces oris TaxID=544580 RepID=UPI0009D6CF1C|nr:DUF58 domain-containing protein [Actinomyces oris]